MGVSSLWEILGPTARPVRLEALSRKRMAVDASIWIYQFLKAVRDTEGNALAQSHIVGFFRRICKLLFHGILPIFVFDGGAPTLKRATILKRKERREGHRESTAQTAQRLLAIQVQRESNTKKPAEDDDTVYLEDLPHVNPQHQTASSQDKLADDERNKTFVRRDEYHLPELKQFKVSNTDTRIMPEEEFKEHSDYSFDFVDGIDINTVDPASDAFAQLPTSTQYMILSHLRLRSRLRMGFSKDQLESLFPNSLDFSKFQIQQVQKRNFYTQRLMNVNGMSEDGGNVTKRIAGDKDRKYALVRNDDGWTLALTEGGEDDPITLDDLGDPTEMKKPSMAVNEQSKNSLANVADEKNPPEDESDIEWEDVSVEEKESEEDKALQQAMIDSIYDQPGSEAKHIDNKTLVPSGDFPASSNSDLTNGDHLDFDEFELRHAIEESKKDLHNLQIQEESLESNQGVQKFDPQPQKQEDTDKNLLFSFDQSLLFGEPAPKQHNTTNEKLSTFGDDFRGITLQSPQHIAPESKHFFERSEQSEKELPIQNRTSGDLRDNKIEHELDAEIDPEHGSDRKADTLVNDGAKEGADHEGAEEVADLEETEKGADHDGAKEVADHDGAKEVADHEGAKEVADNEETEKAPTPRGRPLPSWFDSGVSQSENPHTQAFSQDTAPTKRKLGDDEEAGLITWREAQDFISGENNSGDYESVENESGEDVQEIAPSEVETKRDEDNSISTAPQSNQDDSIDEKTERKPAVLDYDFEEDEENDLVEQLRVEEEEHEQFKSQIKSKSLGTIPIINTSVTDAQILQEKYQKSKRDSDEVTQNMISDVQELLKRFGIPYITGPMEAEAQCAELLKLNLVDGIITDDSDCFLFGGNRVYKNMFNQKQYVECYIMSDIEGKIGLTQEKLIDLGLLLGSDYTEGIKGIGPVLAMEILAEFGSLESFKNWYDENTKKIPNRTNLTNLKKTLLNRIKNGKLFLPDSFPDSVIRDAYLHPEVDHDTSDFRWGIPNLDQIRSFLMFSLNWSQAKVDEVLVPLVRDINRKRAEGTQSTIGEFFPQQYVSLSKTIGQGKRMKNAADKLNKRSNQSKT